MAISKIGSKALVDCSVAAVDIADNSITAAKLAGSIANAKLANSSVTINSTSVSLGGSANINALDWQSVIVADGSTGTTGVAGRGYFINTTSAAHTFTLPVSATRGDTIAIKDYAGTFATFNLTIGRNGHNIQGSANNSLIITNRASVVLVYVDVTRGWEYVTESNVAEFGPLFITATGGTVTTSGDFKIHTFTGDGCFVVSQLGNPAGGGAIVDYLVVAGGGSGGKDQSGGGGAGGFREGKSSPAPSYTASPLVAPAGITVTATTFPVTVGAGGAAFPTPTCGGASGNSGSPSIFSTITSAGGGGGSGIPGGAATSGGSGGGGGGPLPSAGTGNTPPTSPSQGNPGGTGGGSNPFYTGGGGGAGTAGSNGVAPKAGGNGGNGATTSISGTPTAYAGGGGAGAGYPAGTFGNGGTGGGGNGVGQYLPSPGNPGSENTGGGGGGGGDDVSGGAGGKGIIIIRYKFQ